eukprot:4048439-Pyramimonas_sp.AAC.1
MKNPRGIHTYHVGHVVHDQLLYHVRAQGLPKSGLDHGLCMHPNRPSRKAWHLEPRRLTSQSSTVSGSGFATSPKPYNIGRTASRKRVQHQPQNFSAPR